MLTRLSTCHHGAFACLSDQALETLRESLLEAIDRPERNLCDLPVSVNEEIEQPLSGGIRLITAPLSGSEVCLCVATSSWTVRWKRVMTRTMQHCSER